MSFVNFDVRFDEMMDRIQYDGKSTRFACVLESEEKAEFLRILGRW